MSMFRILQMKGVSFGRFTNQNFNDFNHPFVVVYGPNETGKSTLTEFVTWMIGGPVGKAAAAQRFGDYKQKLSGELQAEVNGHATDISGKFEVLDKGAPNDNRTVVMGSSSLTAKQFATSLGNLQANDYAFIYRFIGPVLHDTESAENFSDILSQFAIGSSMSDVNPAEIVKQLNSHAEKIKKEMGAIDKILKPIKEQLSVSLAAPRRLQEIATQLDDIERGIEELNQHDDMVARHIGFLNLAIDSFDQREELVAAQNALNSVPVPSAIWSTAIAQSEDIKRQLSALKDTYDEMATSQASAEQEAAKVGVAFADVVQRHFSLEDKSRIHTAGVALQTAESAVADAEKKTKDTTDELNVSAKGLQESAHALGRTVPDVLAMPSIDAVWQSMNNAAFVWSNKEQSARDKAIAAETAQQRASTEQEKLEIQTKRLGTGSTTATSRKPFQLIGLAVAIAGLIVGIFTEVVIIPAIILAALMFALSLTRGGAATSTSGATSEIAEAEAICRAAQLAASAASGAVSEARTEADGARETFAGFLVPFGVSLPSAEFAQDLCQRLLAALTFATRVRETEAAMHIAGEELRFAQTRRDDAAEAFRTECASVGITYTGSLDGLVSWLDQYHNAHQKASEASRLRQKFSNDRASVQAMFGEVAPAESDLLSLRLLEELQQQVDIAHARHLAEQRLARAQEAVKHLMGGKQEVQELLDSVETKAELESKIGVAQSDRQDMKDRRDAFVASRTELLSEKSKIENTEFINELNLKKSQCEEEKEELESSREAALLASATLKSVIDEFQLKNQGPLVKRANELLNHVVPGYGDLVYSTDDQGKPVIERVSTSGRLRTGKLSTGSRALAYLALRLAFVEADQSKRGIALPVLCDDPLVHIDDSRAPEVMKILAQAAQHRQVILFTCHEDTRDLAMAAGAHVIALSSGS